jgi:hypothetical protein
MRATTLAFTLVVGSTIATAEPQPRGGKPAKARPAPAARPAWAKASSDRANGIDAPEIAVAHKDIEKACGHPVRVEWDWPSFAGHPFDGYSPGAVGAMCVGEVLFRIGVMCGDEKTASVRKINSVTCRYKECTELPPAAWDRNDGILDPGFEYALDQDGTNLAVSFCDKSSTVGSYDLYRWIKNPHYPVVKKPGSVQRKD